MRSSQKPLQPAFAACMVWAAFRVAVAFFGVECIALSHFSPWLTSPNLDPVGHFGHV